METVFDRAIRSLQKGGNNINACPRFSILLMERAMKTQVLIVGAGPVGLTMAAEIARYGVSVRIVDKAAQRTDKSKAIVLWSRTLELLNQAGCSGSFMAA